TRWSSAYSDPQWLQVDLGSVMPVCQVVITWEAAYATAYQIQVSADALSWTTVFTTTTGAGGTETLNVNGAGRDVRFFGTGRALGYGYSFWEFVMHTGSAPTPTTPPTSPSSSPPPGTLISQFRPVAASSYEGGNAPGAALDGRLTTR